mmetsp:Transcript_37340/g.88363  ORF Transcript_37340/g.88363 Transcript_37340/m.88363 type:complete len:252 (+) Transcript_37340:2445-3200(+)
MHYRPCLWCGMRPHLRCGSERGARGAAAARHIRLHQVVLGCVEVHGHGQPRARLPYGGHPGLAALHVLLGRAGLPGSAVAAHRHHHHRVHPRCRRSRDRRVPPGNNWLQLRHQRRKLLFLHYRLRHANDGGVCGGAERHRGVHVGRRHRFHSRWRQRARGQRVPARGDGDRNAGAQRGCDVRHCPFMRHGLPDHTRHRQGRGRRQIRLLAGRSGLPAILDGGADAHGARRHQVPHHPCPLVTPQDRILPRH